MRATWVVVVLVAVASTVGAGVGTDGSDCPVDVEDEGEPGQELANVVGEQESVVARELQRRGFNATLENATSPSERATVVAAELDRIDARLTQLEACRAALASAREDGNLSATEYREQARTLEPEIEDVDERIDRSADVADDLPTREREQNDVEEERFEELTERVEDLQAFVATPDRAVSPTDEDEATDDGATPAPVPGEGPPTDEPATDDDSETSDGTTTDEETGDGQDTEETPEPDTETETPDEPGQGDDDGDDGRTTGSDIGGSSSGAVPR